MEHRIAQEGPHGNHPLPQTTQDLGFIAHYAPHHDRRVRHHEWCSAGDRARSCYGRDMKPDMVSFATLTPYALLGLCFGPVAGVLASKFGYRSVLRAGLIVSIAGVLFGIFLSNNASIPSLAHHLGGLGYRVCWYGEHMLNGLGIVLSPEDNPGYLPRPECRCFQLGRRSFVRCPLCGHGCFCNEWGTDRLFCSNDRRSSVARVRHCSFRSSSRNLPMPTTARWCDSMSKVIVFGSLEYGPFYRK